MYVQQNVKPFKIKRHDVAPWSYVLTYNYFVDTLVVHKDEWTLFRWMRIINLIAKNRSRVVQIKKLKSLSELNWKQKSLEASDTINK